MKSPLKIKLDQRSKYLRSLVVRSLIGGGRGHMGSAMSLIEMLRGNPIEAQAYVVWVPQTIQGMERNICIRERVILVQHSFD